MSPVYASLRDSGLNRRLMFMLWSSRMQNKLLIDFLFCITR